MARYQITLASTTDRTLRTARYVVMSTVDDAARAAAGLLRARRAYHHRGHDWNIWTVAGSLSPGCLPKVLAAGRAERE